MSLIKLNGVEIKTPDQFSISRFNLTKSGRTANGMMTMDLVAKKRKFNIGYTVISGKELNKILDIIDTDEMFFTIEYQESGVTKTATVYVGEIPTELFRTDGVWYWKNVTFSLIEQ